MTSGKRVAWGSLDWGLVDLGSTASRKIRVVLLRSGFCKALIGAVFFIFRQKLLGT